jgi:hypothetical protein
MVDFSNELGQKIFPRLQNEKLIWLSTVDSYNPPPSCQIRVSLERSGCPGVYTA